MTLSKIKGSIIITAVTAVFYNEICVIYIRVKKSCGKNVP